MRRSADFIQTYIFPGGLLLDEPRFAALATERGLSWDDARRICPGLCRDPEAAGENGTTVRSRAASSTSSTTRFHQLWRYYLMYCEGGFRGGAIDVAQVTMVKG